MNPEATLVSFVVRFVYEDPLNGSDGAPPAWHGVIRHVQTNTERHFTRWSDALVFMSQYVDLRDEMGLPATLITPQEGESV